MCQRARLFGWVLLWVCTACAAPLYTQILNQSAPVFIGISQLIPDGDSVLPTDNTTYAIAWEQLAATRVAIELINQQGLLFPNRTFEYLLTNSMSDQTDAILGFLQLATSWPGNLGHTVPLVIGYLETSAALGGATMSKLTNVPVISDGVASTSLLPQVLPESLTYPSFPFPIFNTPEYDLTPFPMYTAAIVSDDAEGLALGHLLLDLHWESFVVVYVNDQDSPAIVSSLCDFAQRQNMSFETYPLQISFTSAITNTNGVAYPVASAGTIEAIDTVLEAISSSAHRIIVLVGSAILIRPVLYEAIQSGLMGPESGNVWVGSSHWLCDTALITYFAPLMGMVLGTTDALLSSANSDFLDLWSSMYQSDPASVFNISQPTNSFGRVNAIEAAARSLRDYIQLVDFCNTSSVQQLLFTTVQLSNNISGCFAVVQASSSDSWRLPLCCILEQRWSMNPQGTVLQYLLRNQSFIGVNGLPVAFAWSGAFKSSVLYVTVENDSLKSFGYFSIDQYSIISDNQRKFLTNGTAVLDLADISWAGSSTPPSDTLTVVYNIQSASDAVVIVCVFFASLGICYSLVLVFGNVYWRKNPVIKLSSPTINDVTLLGAIMGFAFCILVAVSGNFDYDSYAQYCTSSRWLFVLSITLMFGSLFSKTLRVHAIFNNPRIADVRNIHDPELFLYLAGLLSIDCLLMGLWTGLSPFSVSVTVDAQSALRVGLDLIQYDATYSCSSTYSLQFTLLLIIYKVALLVFGTWLAWQVRNVAVKALNDSQWIGFSIYFSVLSSAIFIPTIFLLNTNPSAEIALICLGFTFVLVGNISILFLCKFVAILRGQEKQFLAAVTKKLACSQSMHEVKLLKREISILRRLLEFFGISKTASLADLQNELKRRNPSLMVTKRTMSEPSSRPPSPLPATRSQAQTPSLAGGGAASGAESKEQTTLPHRSISMSIARGREAGDTPEPEIEHEVDQDEFSSGSISPTRNFQSEIIPVHATINPPSQFIRAYSLRSNNSRSPVQTSTLAAQPPSSFHRFLDAMRRQGVSSSAPSSSSSFSSSSSTSSSSTSSTSSSSSSSAVNALTPSRNAGAGAGSSDVPDSDLHSHSVTTSRPASAAQDSLSETSSPSLERASGAAARAPPEDPYGCGCHLELVEAVSDDGFLPDSLHRTSSQPSDIQLSSRVRFVSHSSSSQASVPETLEESNTQPRV